MHFPLPTGSRLVRFLAASCALLAAVTAGAVDRKVQIQAPGQVKPNTDFQATISASTNAADGEKVGFLQLDASVDGGRTWSPVCYLDNLGTSFNRVIGLKSGRAGSAVKIRVRVAFRNGHAADVDYNGAAIRWTESWDKWQEPPAKSVTISVKE